MMQNPLELDWTDTWPQPKFLPCHGGRPATHAVMPWAETIPYQNKTIPRLCGGNEWIRG